jgi:hypothetical protein
MKTRKVATEFTTFNIEKPAGTGYGTGYESDLMVGIGGRQCSTFDVKTILVIAETLELHGLRCLQSKSVLSELKCLRLPAIRHWLIQHLLRWCFVYT